MTNPIQAFLVFVIITGVFGIIIGWNDRRSKGSLLASSKPFLRGCFMAASGSIVLVLFLRNILPGWIAVGGIGILILIQEYAIMAIARFREQRSRPDDLLANQPLPEVKEKETWGQVRKKGLARFVIINTALYGFTAILFTCFAVVLAPEQIPLYIAISIILAGAAGGATAAIRQWNWHERKERSVGVKTGSKKRIDD